MTECQTSRLQDQVAELQERLERAERLAAKRAWYRLPAREGLYVPVMSDEGDEIRCATNHDADRLVAILNNLEQAAALRAALGDRSDKQ